MAELLMAIDSGRKSHRRSAPPAVHQDAQASSQDAWNHMQDRHGVYATPQQQHAPLQPARQLPLQQQQRPMPYESLVRPQGAPREWQEGYCECCSPFSLCMESWCCPCLVYGRTHHRLRNDGDMSNFDTCNGSCWVFFASMYFGLAWIPVWLQRSDLRNKHHLKGSSVTDCLSACCCGVCDIAQVEKETERRERAPGSQALGYQRRGNMVATRKN